MYLMKSRTSTYSLYWPGVPAAAPVVAKGPEFTVEFGFLESHYLREVVAEKAYFLLSGGEKSITLDPRPVEQV